MKNILALTYWSYKGPLVQSGALPYLNLISKTLPKGSRIFLFTLEKDNYRITKEEEKKIFIELAEYNITLIRKRYYPFGIISLLTWLFYFIHLLFICFIQKINFIHVWCTPAGIIGYFLSMLTGRKLIIDSYEPHAETMVETGNWTKNSLAFKILFYFEKLQSKKAYAVIALSTGMKDYAKEKYNITFIRYYIRSTCVDFNLFKKENINTQKIKSTLGIKDNDIVCVYSGKIGGIYLDEEIFDFFESTFMNWGEKFKVLMLTDAPRTAILKYLQKYRINEQRIISLYVSHNEVKYYLACASFAICPVKPIPTKKFCSPIKTGEYWAMGLPVVITKNISDDSDIIRENKIGAVIESLDKPGYLKAIKEIDNLLRNNSREELYNKIRPIAEKYRNFSIAENVYKEIYGE